MVELLVEMMPKALNVEYWRILAHNTRADEVWLQTGPGVNQKQFGVDRSDSPAGHVIATGEYVAKGDADKPEGPHGQVVDAKTGVVIGNEWCVPITRSLFGQKASGAILVLNKKKGQYFREEDREFLERVAGHLQTGIESTFLRQEPMDFSEFLIYRARVSQRLRYGLWVLLAVARAHAVTIAYLWGRA